MPEKTSWEEHHKNRLSRIFRWFTTILFIAIVAGIIIYNNSGRNESTVPQKNVVSTAVSSAKNGYHSSPADTQRPSKGFVDKKSAKPNVVEKKPLVRQPDSSVSFRTVHTKPAVAARTQSVLARDSVAIMVRNCRVLDRKDLRLHCQIMCYVKDADAAEEVFLKQNAIRAIVVRLIGSYALASVKHEQLQPGMFKAINDILDTGKISDIALQEIRIEKVLH